MATIYDQIKLHAHVLMMHMSFRVGIKKFGEKGNEALMKELQQLHDRKAKVPKKGRFEHR